MATGSKVVFYAPKDIRIEAALPPPAPAAGEVLVRVEACAICGSDVKTYLLGNPRITPPRTMGHEFCGVIETVGEGVGQYRPGQRVAMATTMGCGSCPECLAGRTNICSDLQAIGFHYDGAMAPWVLIPERGVRGGNLVDVGDLNPAFAALSEPTSCVVNSLSRLDGRGARSLLVIGLGPLGLIHGLMARELGIETVVGAARPGARFDAAQNFGLDAVVMPGEIPAAIKRFTGGRGFDAVVVTAPSAEMQSAAPAYAATSGAISLFAGLPKGSEMITLNSRTIHYGEQTVYGTSDSTVEHVRRAVRWLGANTPVLDKLVTHRFPMARFHDAMDAVMNRQAVKAVLFPEVAP
jgi:L-iditol 2-dehydrogenase